MDDKTTAEHAADELVTMIYSSEVKRANVSPDMVSAFEAGGWRRESVWQAEQARPVLTREQIDLLRAWRDDDEELRVPDSDLGWALIAAVDALLGDVPTTGDNR